MPAGYALTEQRLDETEVGEGTTVTLINATRPGEWEQTNNPYDCYDADLSELPIPNIDPD